MTSILDLVKKVTSDMKRNLETECGNESKLNAFQHLESQYEGFLTMECAVLWDCLLRCQAKKEINGHMLEIGVYKGRSALLSALHLNPKEEFVLIDGTPFIHEAEKSLKSLLGKEGFG